jgi:site-specific DNA-methyltransferase (adenine-specific)
MNTLTLGSWQDSIVDVPDESVDLIIIDPPYMTTGEKWDKKEAVNDELSRQLFRIAKPSCSLYVWCGIGEKSQSLIRWFPIFSEHWRFKDLITWKKQRGIGMRKGWLYTREELMWFVKDNKQFVWNKEHQYSKEKREKSSYGYVLPNGKKADDYIKSEYKRIANVWSDISETTFNTSKKGLIGKHFTPKPQAAIERIVQLHTREGDVVFDCFAGSGTTGVVAKKMNRRYIMIEKEAEYMDLIVERLANV